MGTDAVTSNSTAVAKQAKAPLTMGERGFNFDFENAQRFALALIDSGMVPKGITKPGAVVGLIQAGKELGLPPMAALGNLTFINGRVGIMGDAAKALIRKSRLLKPGTDFDAIYSGQSATPDRKCTVTAHRVGEPQPFESSFSLRDAEIAGIARIWQGKVQARARGGGWDDSGPWATYTDRMLMYRATGFLCRDHFSDVLLGCVFAEELRDYPAAASTRSVPPPEPDPLLSGATTAASADDSDIINAEVVDDEEAPPQVSSEIDDLTVRCENLKSGLAERNTLVGVQGAWKAGADLRSELQTRGEAEDGEPFRAMLADLNTAYAARRRELGAKD